MLLGYSINSFVSICVHVLAKHQLLKLFRSTHQCLCFSPSMDSSSDRDEPDQTAPAGIWLVPLFSASCFILFSLFCPHIFLPPLHWLLFPSCWLYAVSWSACVSTFSDMIPAPSVCVHICFG